MCHKGFSRNLTSIKFNADSPGSPACLLNKAYLN
ncbi:hypothetical protein [Pseudomonas phage HMGUpa1]|nr:hypothetical protein [Pseudomonas phage HMGUpa1]